MKFVKFMFVLLAMLFVMAPSCDSQQTVSGTVIVDVPQTTVEVRMNQGILMIREVNQIGIVIVCMSVDSSTLYLDSWEDIDLQNLQRTVAYTAAELALCPQ